MTETTIYLADSNISWLRININKGIIYEAGWGRFQCPQPALHTDANADAADADDDDDVMMIMMTMMIMIMMAVGVMMMVIVMINMAQ